MLVSAKVEKMIHEEAPGIYSVPHSAAEGKNVIVFSKSMAIAIDVGTFPEEGEMLANFIREKGYEPNKVIITHGHRDHILGGEVFQGSDIYAPRKTVDEIERQIPSLAKQLDLDIDTITTRILHPTFTFDDQMWINLGDKQLHLFPTPGHSPDIVSIYVKEHNLLIASDTVVTGIVPAIFYSSRELESSLNKLKSLDIETLIAGHGRVLYGRDTVQDWLNWLTQYISGVRIAIQKKITSGERDIDAIADSIDYDQYIEDRLPKDKHGMPKRHRNTVLQIIAEELSKL